MIAQDFFRVRVLGAFSRGARGGTPRKKEQREGEPLARKSSARGNPSQEKRRKHSHCLWWSEHVPARGKRCPTVGAVGAAPGPAPPCEGAASAICSREELRKNGNSLLKPNGIQLTNKRLGEICGLGRYPQFGMTFRANRSSES